MDDQNLEHKIGTSWLIVFDGACGTPAALVHPTFQKQVKWLISSAGYTYF